MNLSESQKKFLRGRGHDLKPVIMVGDGGLSESLLAEFRSAIDHHELIKVKIRSGDRETRDKYFNSMCADSDAELIQRIGNVGLLYRANPKKKPTQRLRIPSR